MSFMDGIHSFTAHVDSKTQAVFVGTATEALNSIQFGSPLTGSLGQPVDTSELRDSWHLELEDANHALIFTSVPWAESNEDGIARPHGGPYIQRSAVGGRWSVALTRAGIQKIVDSEAVRLAR